MSDKEGEDTIFVNGVEEFRKVPVKTLDSFNLKNIGFIKIDVEGFEEKVIRGGLLTIISNNYNKYNICNKRGDFYDKRNKGV